MARRALLVGVDVYPDPRNNLNSCVADTLAFKALLQNTYQFEPAAITLMHNQAATLANARAGLDTLFANAHHGDQLVYFESSHGYRYPDGDTMVEVLCLYDGFLKDTEFAERTQGLPAEVLTVVLDSCHSGGMNKVFFPAGDVQVARAKVWQPPIEDAERDAQLYAQVTKFKFFGRASAGDTAAVAKNFVMDVVGVGQQKDLAEGAVDLNGALLSACQADQTAAAGSPQTNNLSAFTYGLASELDPRLSLSDLNQRIVARLKALNMNQTPTAVAPPLQPELLTETAPAPAQIGNGGFDPDAWLRTQLGSLF
jgi:hypothetical protein